MKYILATFLILATYTSSNAAPLLHCDQDVNLDNGYSYKNITGDISCQDEDGVLRRKARIENGDLINDKRYGRNGILFSDQSFKQGYKEGVSKIYYEDTGRLKEVMQYQKGKLVGIQKLYQPDGATLAAIRYQDFGSHVSISNVSFNMQGQPTSIQCGARYPSEFDEYCKNPVQLYSNSGAQTRVSVPASSQYSGVVTNKDGTGNVSGEVSYKDGKLNGPQKIMGINGHIATIKNFENGRVAGEQVTYFENSDQVKERAYVDPQLHKITKIEEFYQNGNIAITKEYIDQRKYVIKEFFDNGKPASETYFLEPKGCNPSTEDYDNSFCSSQIYGESKDYDRDGKLKVSYYDDKSNIFKIVSFDTTGKETETKYYYPDGSEKR